MNILNKITAENIPLDRMGLEPERYDYHTIDLNAFDMIEPDAAHIIAKYRGAGLLLGGLKAISVEVARALAKNTISIFLEGLETLPDDVATALASSGVSNIHLNSFVDASDNSLEILALGNAEIGFGGDLLFALAGEESVECGSLRDRFNRIVATSPKVAEKKRRLAAEVAEKSRRIAAEADAREAASVIEDRLRTADERNWLEKSMKQARKLIDRYYHPRVGFLWGFLGGFSDWVTRDWFMEVKGCGYVHRLLPSYPPFANSQIHRRELELLESERWKVVLSLTMCRSIVVVGRLASAASREHSVIEKLFRRREAVRDIRRALDDLDKFLTPDGKVIGSRGAILATIAALDPSERKRKLETEFGTIWSKTISEVQLPLASAVDRMRAAGCSSEIAVLQERLSQLR